MKKILMILPSLIKEGGVGKIVTNIGDNLVNNGYEIKYLTFHNVEKKYDFLGEEICLNEIHSTKIIINLYRLFKRAYKIKSICKKYNIDISISHMEECNFSNIISKFFFNKSKIYCQVHLPIEVLWKNYRLLIKILYKYSDGIITLGNREKLNLINNFGIKDNKITIIPNAIDIQKINELKKESLGNDKIIFEDNSFIFMNCAKLIPLKNQSIIIKSFKELNKKYKNIKLLIVGGGILEKELKNESKGNKNIFIIGNKENPIKYMNKSNCFVFSSIYEGFGISIIEAMVCSLPIISTDCPTGPKEILEGDSITNFIEVNDIKLGKYGILVPNNSQIDFEKAMEKIYLDKNLREKYSKLSIERGKDFELKKIIKKWEKIINS